MISCKCPHCHRNIRADDKYAGRIVACPGCKKQVKIPDGAEIPVASPTASHSPSSIPIRGHKPEPAPVDQEVLSWLASSSSPASSSGNSEQRSASSEEEKAPLTPFRPHEPKRESVEQTHVPGSLSSSSVPPAKNGFIGQLQESTLPVPVTGTPSDSDMLMDEALHGPEKDGVPNTSKALRSCPDCGKMISKHAYQCPSCGCPVTPSSSDSSPASPSDHSRDQSYSSGPKEKAEHASSGWRNRSVFFWITLVICTYWFFIRPLVPSFGPSSDDSGDGPYNRGYAGGDLWGELNRNGGSPPDVEQALELHFFDIKVTGGNTGDPIVAKDPRYKKSVVVPEKGTQDFGEYIKGFRKGYHDSYH